MTRVFTVLQPYESVVLYFNTHDNSFLSIMEVESNKTSEPCYSVHGASNEQLPHLMWTAPGFGGGKPPDHHFLKDQRSVLGTSPGLENSIHASPTVPKSGLKQPWIWNNC